MMGGARWLAVVSLCVHASATADGPDVLSMRLGSTGLLQTPNARLAGTGEFRTGFSNVHPYRAGYLTVEPFSRLQGTFRYTSIQDRDFGTEQRPQSFKDKSFDAKLLLLREGTWNPAIAVGLIDFGGTGLLSSEYVVASRRVFDFDLSLGLGWGRLGSRGAIRNPFVSISDRFEVRERDDTRGGTLNTAKYFSGPGIHPFGGVQWTPSGGPWTLVVEYDSNDFTTDRTGRRRTVDSPINYGVNYRAWDRVDLSLSWERGNTVGFHVGFRTNFNIDPDTPKIFDRPPPAIPPRLPAPTPASTRSDQEIVDAIVGEMSGLRYTTESIHLDAESGLASVWFSQESSNDAPLVAGRAARSATLHLPPDYHTVRAIELRGDVERFRVDIPREEFHSAVANLITPDELSSSLRFMPPEAGAHRRANFAALRQYPDFHFGLAPGVRYNLGRPDGFVIGRITAVASASVDLSPRLSLNAAYGYSLIDNADNLEFDSNSRLPQVRTLNSAYLREGESYLQTLEANYIWPLSSSLTARISAGITDEMFGGVGSEILYQPFASRWAIGANINRVRQRDFQQRFGFFDYEVTTGHLTFYYESSWQNLLTQLSFGRYLAGDRGATLDISRRFNNGVRVGAWGTMTNVSQRQFGEGSFDKGFYFDFPFDLFLPRSTSGVSSFVFRPIQRDGGQKVRDGQPLYFRHGTRAIDGLMNIPGQYLR